MGSVLSLFLPDIMLQCSKTNHDSFPACIARNATGGSGRDPRRDEAAGVCDRVDIQCFGARIFD
jgi:hypothetical protein